MRTRYWEILFWNVIKDQLVFQHSAPPDSSRRKNAQTSKFWFFNLKLVTKWRQGFLCVHKGQVFPTNGQSWSASCEQCPTAKCDFSSGVTRYKDVHGANICLASNETSWEYDKSSARSSHCRWFCHTSKVPQIKKLSSYQQQ